VKMAATKPDDLTLPPNAAVIDTSNLKIATDKMANLQMTSNIELKSAGSQAVTTTGWIRATITHSILGVRAEKSYNPNLTGEELKEKLHMIVGTKPAHMKLQLKDKEGKTVCEIGDKQKLSSLPLEKQTKAMHIHVLDVDPQKSMLEFTDVSKVKKFEITEKDYDKRTNTFRKWAKQNLKGHYAKKEKERQEKAEEGKKQEEKEKLVAEKIKVGDRCQLGSNTEFPRRGEVKFVGALSGKPGTFIGIQLDEPYGKNNGSVNGVSYFSCMPKCGIFVRPSAVEVGDFPEEDIFDEL